MRAGAVVSGAIKNLKYDETREQNFLNVARIPEGEGIDFLRGMRWSLFLGRLETVRKKMQIRGVILYNGLAKHFDDATVRTEKFSVLLCKARFHRCLLATEWNSIEIHNQNLYR